MRINIGYELTFECPQPTPMLLLLTVHPSRAPELIKADPVMTEPSVPVRSFIDAFGNWCSRIVAPTGTIRIFSDALIAQEDCVTRTNPGAGQIAVEALPDDVLMYLLGSRYCETDVLSTFAWQQFGWITPGWARVKAVCDFAHNHIRFDYAKARATRTAADAMRERVGVCRDYTHLAVALCRALNIPARYCTGYLGDINIPVSPAPMDFSAWFEAYLDGEWYTFDPRNNQPRMGYVLMARGRDAADVPISHTFGANVLSGFKVRAEESKQP